MGRENSKGIWTPFDEYFPILQSEPQTPKGVPRSYPNVQLKKKMGKK